MTPPPPITSVPSEVMRSLARRHAPEAQLRRGVDGVWFISLFRHRLLYERPDGAWDGRVYLACDGTQVDARTGPPEDVFGWAMGRTTEEYRG